MLPGEPLVQLVGVTKEYRALRPLRIQQLELRPGQTVALMGLDLAMAEVLSNLITGAQLPDTGEVRVFGQLTSAIKTSDEWVETLDRFGLISERAVLIDQFTVEQNLALPLSLQIEDIAPAVHDKVRQIADVVAIPGDRLGSPTGSLSPGLRARLRLGRALALDPKVLLAEHPNASLEPDEVPAFGVDLARAAKASGVAMLVVTADAAFAKAAAAEVLTLEPATGTLRAQSGWRRWFATTRNGT